jgi:hypothetical protein
MSRPQLKRAYVASLLLTLLAAFTLFAVSVAAVHHHP